MILFYSLIFLLTGSCFTFNMFTCVNGRFVYVFVCICAYMYAHVGGGGRVEGEEVYKAMESERIRISERIYVECFEVIVYKVLY